MTSRPCLCVPYPMSETRDELSHNQRRSRATDDEYDIILLSCAHRER
jgi:hypothetical protein